MADLTPDRPAPPAGGGGPDEPPSQPPVTYAGGRPPAVPYPIVLEADYPEEGIDRWRPLVQWLLAVPHLIVLAFVAFAASIALIGAWFAVVFTRRYPPGIFNFVAGTLRWGERVSAYALFLVEPYPAFALGDDPGYPVRVRFEYPEGGIARWRPFVHWLLAIPHFIVLSILGALAYLAVIIAFFAVVITRSYPAALWNFLVGLLRWRARVTGYTYFMAEKYPPFSID